MDRVKFLGFKIFRLIAIGVAAVLGLFVAFFIAGAFFKIAVGLFALLGLATVGYIIYDIRKRFRHKISVRNHR